MRSLLSTFLIAFGIVGFIPAIGYAVIAIIFQKAYGGNGSTLAIFCVVSCVALVGIGLYLGKSVRSEGKDGNG